MLCLTFGFCGNRRGCCGLLFAWCFVLVVWCLLLFAFCFGLMFGVLGLLVVRCLRGVCRLAGFPVLLTCSLCWFLLELCVGLCLLFFVMVVFVFG